MRPSHLWEPVLLAALWSQLLVILCLAPSASVFQRGLSCLLCVTTCLILQTQRHLPLGPSLSHLQDFCPSLWLQLITILPSPGICSRGSTPSTLPYMFGI